MIPTKQNLITEYQRFRERSHFGSLNGVRCFCVIAVIWHHTTEKSDVISLANRGFLGVDMFFVLSGFLIVTLLLREKERHEKISLKNFYLRRSLRIFPVYYGILFFLAVAYAIFKADDLDTQVFFTALPMYLLYLSNWSLTHAANLGITWSLATEEQFYLIWPLLEKAVKARVIYYILAVFFLINQAVNFGLLDSLYLKLFGEDIPPLNILDTTFTPICLGIALAHLLHRQKTYTRIAGLLRHGAASILVFCALIATISFTPGDISGWPRLVIHLLMAIWLGTLVVNEDNRFKKILSFRVIRRIGEISYGVYLYHLWALHGARVIIDRFGLDFALSRFLICTVLTVIISDLSFRFFEKPFLHLKKRFV